MSSLGERLAWYRARLASMSALEVAHRFLEAASKQAARRHNRGWPGIKTLGPLVSLPEVAARLENIPAGAINIIAREANDVRLGRFHFLGAGWPESSTMPPARGFWFLDPADGQLFPQRDDYCFDISFRHGVGTSEIKRIWEINRLQFLVPLAADAAINRDQQSIDLLTGIIRSWMEDNAPYRGLNWIFGIELSLRVISVGLAVSVIGPEAFDAAMHGMLLQFFYAHVDWIQRFPSLYSSANNHRIAELTGMLVGIAMIPSFPNAREIRKNGWDALLVELNRQILPDGVGAEQSPTYAAFSIELCLLAAAACRHKLPPPIADRLSAWAEYSLWLMDADGRVPAIGDCDDSRVIATTQAHESRYVASIVAAVAGCIGRADLAPPARDEGIRDVVLGSAGVSEISRTGMRSFRDGGYSVIRSADGRLAVLTFDHGPLGYLSIAAHGHADALAVWLSVGNQPLFVDAGTYLYHSSRSLRNAFRDTAVHNTLALGGAPSSHSSGPFNWAEKANSYLVSSENSSRPRIIAEHDGYLSQYGARHRRIVEFDGTSCFTITDELLGAPQCRSVAVSFLLDVACEATLDPGQAGILISINHRSIVRISSAGPLKARIVRGDEKSAHGWVSPSFGVRKPTDHILFEGELQTPSVITIDLLGGNPV